VNKEAIILEFERESKWGKLFKSTNGESVFVKQYQEGNLVLDASSSMIDTIYHVSQFVEGCFAEGSNVNRELSEAYSTDNVLKQISFVFCGIKITATDTDTVDNIIKQLHDGYAARYEEYKKNPQGTIDTTIMVRKYQ